MNSCHNKATTEKNNLKSNKKGNRGIKNREFYLKIWLTKKLQDKKEYIIGGSKEKTVRFRYNPQSLGKNYFLQIKRLNKPNENIQCTYKRHISNI